ncbi:hypothetical protein AB0E04_46245 [Streptomyces sp. NPDC048251]|uniref:hypothetical protein n=1 Tax=Streptomyces sp. NPDC048251 TaxID=3154501 RepID=UPI00341508EC
MSTPPAINLSTHLYRCRLGQRELDALFTVAGQGFQPGEIEFSHERHSRTFTAPTLADLVSDVRAAPLPGDPDTWNNLTFTATDPAGRRTVTMVLSPKKVTTTVTGTDATLVYGTDTQIRLYLVDDAIGGRTSRKGPSSPSLLGTLIVGVAIIFVLALAFSKAADGGKTGESIKNFLDAAGPFIVTGYGLLGLGAMLHTAALGLGSRGVLAPTRLLPTGGVWNRLSTMEKMTGIGVFVAALAAAGTLISAGTDLFK